MTEGWELKWRLVQADIDTHRAMVPGGWIYRVRQWPEEDHFPPTVALAFVPDPEMTGSWATAGWEALLEPVGDRGPDAHTLRMLVPGGWIYLVAQGVVKSDAPATIALTFVPEPGAEPAHIRKPVSSRADVVQRARNDVLRYLRANVVDRVGHRCSPPRPVRSEANMPNDDAKADPDITLTDELDPADFAVIADGLSAYDFARIGYLDFRRLSVVVRDPQTGKVVGGLYGRSSLGLFYVDWLFLPEDLRGSGIGSRVLAMAEEEAQRRGCTRVTLTTLSVEAPGFYQKQGYDIAVTIDCEPPGLIHYYMMKRLVPLRR